VETKKFGSSAKHVFTKGFIIESNHLQTIESMIRERFQGCIISYEVTFNNSNVYTTGLLDDVVSEENSTTKNITKLEISATIENEFSLKINFEKDEKIKLSMTGENRDLTFLLFNQMKTYIDNEIAIVRRWKHSSDMYFFVVTITLIFVVVAFLGPMIQSEIRSVDITGVLATDDLGEKLNFLIEYQITSGQHDFTFPLILSGIAVSVLILSGIAIRFVRPISDYFLIGKEISKYEKKVETRQRVIWGIVVTTIISVAGGIVVFFITSNIS